MSSGQSSVAGTCPVAAAVIPPLEEEWGVKALFSVRSFWAWQLLVPL